MNEANLCKVQTMKDDFNAKILMQVLVNTSNDIP